MGCWKHWGLKGSGMVDRTFPSCFGSDGAFPIVTFSASGAMQAWDINRLVHALYVARMQKAGIKKKLVAPLVLSIDG